MIYTQEILGPDSLYPPTPLAPTPLQIAPLPGYASSLEPGQITATYPDPGTQTVGLAPQPIMSPGALAPKVLHARRGPITGGIGDANSRGGIYLLRGPVTGEVMRTGRATRFVKRRSDHATDPRTPETHGLDFEPVYRTDNKAEQRGLEQYIAAQYPDAPLNREVPVSTKRSKAQAKAIYEAARNTFYSGPIELDSREATKKV